MKSKKVINTLNFNPEKCIGCSRCIEVCPHGVFKANGKAVELARAEACIECGACRLNCPAGAIAVDSGVGCAYAMIFGALTSKKEDCCSSGCSCG